LKVRPVYIYYLILAITGFMRGAESNAAPDAVYFHGKVYTVDDRLGERSAFAVRGDRIVAVGSDKQILAMAGKSTQRVDLGDAAVIPGMSDAHDHFWNAWRYLIRGVDMVGVNSRAELEARLRVAVSKAKPGEVVFTTVGWVVQPALTRKDLDQISDSIPIVLIADRKGRSTVNGAALKRLGISKNNPAFRGVQVPVDKNGEPTGGSPDYPLSVRFVEDLLPPLATAQQDEIVKEAEDQCHALGITAVRDLAAWSEEVTTLERLRREGKLTLRIALGLEFPDQKDLPAYIEKQPALQHNDPWLYVDSQSEEPWSPGSATEEEFTRLVRAENRAGWRPAPHISSDPHRGTTADQATDDALVAYEAANRDSSIVGKRWYVEHVPFATPAQINRMAALGLIVSVQDAGYDLPAVAPLPPDRMAHWNPVREFLDQKIVVVAGSDYHGPDPATRDPNNPIIDFYFYVTRRTRSGEVQTPTEKISRDEALRILTYNEAYATFQENVRGKIAPGMLADFVILNQNLMTVPEDQILFTRAVATYVGGIRVYEAPASANMGIAQKP